MDGGTLGQHSQEEPGSSMLGGNLRASHSQEQGVARYQCLTDYVELKQAKRSYRDPPRNQFQKKNQDEDSIFFPLSNIDMSIVFKILERKGKGACFV